jgi:hypothetical protein
VTVSDKCYWNEIKIGCVFKTGPLDLGAIEIRAFAMHFGPQPAIFTVIRQGCLKPRIKKAWLL